MNSFVRSFYTLTSEFPSSFIVFFKFLNTNFHRFYEFPRFIEATTFGISCDAFANLKETLTRHKPMVAEYLDKNYDRVRVTQPHFYDSKIAHFLKKIKKIVFRIFYNSYSFE